jgi:hypothetical protein
MVLKQRHLSRIIGLRRRRRRRVGARWLATTDRRADVVPAQHPMTEVVTRHEDLLFFAAVQSRVVRLVGQGGSAPVGLERPCGTYPPRVGVAAAQPQPVSACPPLLPRPCPPHKRRIAAFTLARPWARSAGMTDCLLGFDRDGNFFIASQTTDVGKLLILIERARALITSG